MSSNIDEMKQFINKLLEELKLKDELINEVIKENKELKRKCGIVDDYKDCVNYINYLKVILRER